MPTNLNPTLYGDFPSLPDPTKTRTFTLIEQGVFPKTAALLLDGQLWGAPTSEKPEWGTTEEWVIVNPTMVRIDSFTSCSVSISPTSTS